MLNFFIDHLKHLWPNGSSIKLLKVLSPHISAPLSLIIIESFLSGIFPDKMQRPKVIPLFKNDVL